MARDYSDQDRELSDYIRDDLYDENPGSWQTAWDAMPINGMSDNMIEHAVNMIETMEDESEDADFWDDLIDDFYDDFWEWYRDNYGGGE